MEHNICKILINEEGTGKDSNNRSIMEHKIVLYEEGTATLG